MTSEPSGRLYWAALFALGLTRLLDGRGEAVDVEDRVEHLRRRVAEVESVEDAELMLTPHPMR